MSNSIKNNFKNLYLESKLKFTGNSIELKIINYINLGIPFNIVGMPGSGKSTLFVNLLKKHSTDYQLIEGIDPKNQIECNYEDLNQTFTKINKCVVVVKLHEFSNPNYISRVLIEIATTFNLNLFINDDFKIKSDTLEDNYMKRFVLRDSSTKKNLDLLRETMLALNQYHCITLVIDDVNDPSLYLKYSSKITKIIDIFNETQQQYAFISTFPIKSIQSLRITNLNLGEIYLNYEFPEKILDKNIFELLKVDEITPQTCQKYNIKEEFEEESSITEDLVGNSLELKENQDLNSNYYQINNEINVIPKTKERKKKKNTSIKQIKINDNTKNFIMQSMELFKLYVFDYNELIYYFKNYSECILSLEKKEFERYIIGYLNGSHIHFSTEINYKFNKNAISHLENYTIYTDLINKSNEQLKFTLSTAQKLFLIASFLASKTSMENDLKIFTKFKDGHKGLKKIKPGIATSYSKKQNLIRVLSIYSSLSDKATMKNRTNYKKDFFKKYFWKNFTLQFFTDIDFLFKVSFLVKWCETNFSNSLNSFDTIYVGTKNNLEFFKGIADNFDIDFSEFF